MKTPIGLLAALCAIACSNADTAANTDTAVENIPAAAAEQPLQAAAADRPLEANATATIQAACQRFMERQRDCSSTFIPALVDARVKIDSPPGLAAHEASIGRQALVKEAFDEWANDSKGAAIAATCEHIASAVAPAREDELRATVASCMELDGCGAFVPCAVKACLAPWQE